VLQCVSVRHSVLQCVAVCCSVLQCVGEVYKCVPFGTPREHAPEIYGAVCCSVLYCVAVCCSRMQCVAECEVIITNISR